MDIFINGKFVTAPRTGVQRVAFEIVKAMDRLKAEGEKETSALEFTLSCPGPSSAPLELRQTKLAIFSKLPALLWEQIYFPWTSRKGVALNICNSGPIVRSRALTVIHDAQVYITPQSYSKAFRLWYKTILPIMGRRHKAIVTVSNFSKQKLVEHGVADAAKITVIYNGVDHILAQPSDSSLLQTLSLTQKRFVVALANTQKHKNISVLLKAFADPRLKDLKLVLFGKADAHDFTDILAEGLPDNVLFAGKITDSQLRGLLENALCLGFPSTTEGFGLPILEAMLLGCPGVVAPCGALPEVCEEATLYASPDKPEAWTEAFERLASSDTLWEEMKKKGQIQGRKFTWERAGRELASLLTKTFPA